MELKVFEKLSPFCHKRGSYPLDTIVIHHIGSNNGKLYSLNGTITWFTDPEVHRNKTTGKIENKVSAHYIIPREPYNGHDLIRTVKDGDIAYHAGKSSWTVDGKIRNGINSYSIGIELEGDGNFVEYTDFQYEVLIKLTKEYIDRYNILEDNIVGHEDISPGRKIDPGKLFDWKRYRSSLTPSETSVVVEMVGKDSTPPAPSTPTTSEDAIEPTEEFHMESGEDQPTFLGTILNLFLKLFQK